jgi:hypothetical protein
MKEKNVQRGRKVYKLSRANGIMGNRLKVAAWCGIVSIVLNVISSFLYSASGGSKIFPIVISVISGILGLFFLYGFIILGKTYKNKLLSVMAWIGIILAVVFLILTLFGFGEKIAGLADISSTEVNVTALVVMWLVASIVLGLYSILFGVGLLRLKKNVEYARASGILSVIAGATYIIFIGFFVQIVASVLELIMFFKHKE